MPNDDLDITQLLDKALEIVRRDINHMFATVAGSKLSPTEARDISNYVKLLSDAEERQKLMAAEAARLANAKASQP